MRKINITTDLIIGVGLCIALILSILQGTSAEIITCIVGNLGGYMGRSLMSEHLYNTTTNSSAPPPQNIQSAKITPIEKGANLNAKG